MMFDNLLGEFIGTMVLIVFGAGVCACNTLTKSKGQNGGWICITAAWGFAVTLGVYTATTLGAPQGDLNPAVTLGKTLIGIYSVPQFFATSIAQILGGILGAAIVWLHTCRTGLKRKINRQNSVSSARLRLSVTIRPTSFANLLRRSS